jgi:YegS/Rv2252/BmrU family lipid kinase
MTTHDLGRTLIVANPAAHSGKGEAAVLFVMRFFSSNHFMANSCEVRLTEGRGDAMRMASDAYEYDTVIALGGDGITHEVVNGLMMIDEDVRPRLGLIPMGSGNDFARTLGMSKNDPERAVAELMDGEERTIDLGRVNGVFFTQTLSFGIDAAIALDTVDRRDRNTMQSGAILFVTSGIKILLTALRGWPYEATIDGVRAKGTDIAFAVQNGPTYGGGFKICPDARPNDGLLDLCYTIEKPSLPHSLLLFGLVRLGRHTRSRKLFLRKVRHVEVVFPGEEQPPCQIDGETLVADRYEIDVMPSALRVIVPTSCSW